MVTFQELYDAMEAAGVEVAIELVADGHRLNLRDRAGDRELCLPVRRGFDHTANVLVQSARLRQALGLYRQAPLAARDGTRARGSWPEFGVAALRPPSP